MKTSNMDYEKKYKEAIERLKQWDREHPDGYVISDRDEFIFPELAESDDERIRKALMQNLKERFGTKGNMGEGLDMPKVLAWLEKQGEQKHAEVEPKFHEGDWVVTDFDNVVRIKAIENGLYVFENSMRFSVGYVDKCWRKWCISDAKDGDVLVDGNLPFIFKKINANKYIYAYCGISVDDGFKIESDGESVEWTWIQDIKPATKEQRDTLMKAMADAGYTFDFEKKELKKIEQKHAEWSKEDERNFDIIYGIIYNSCIAEDASRLNTWLLSLKPQKQWKPSKEQLNGLKEAIEFLGCTKTRREQLQSLYEQLKKLREE